jgi:hypothetical protein
LNDSVVVVRAFRLVSGGRQGGGGKLQGSVVCDVELPVGTKRRCLAFLQILDQRRRAGRRFPAGSSCAP